MPGKRVKIINRLFNRPERLFHFSGIKRCPTTKRAVYTYRVAQEIFTMSVPGKSSYSNENGSNDASPKTHPCLLCGGLKSYAKYDFGPHKIFRCENCNFMWLNPLPSREELKEVYNSDYFRNKGFYQEEDEHIYGYYDYISERMTKQARYYTLMEEVVSFLGNFEPEVSRFLDIGCGLGYLLDVASDKGFQVAGTEFNPDAVEKIRKKYVFPIFCGDLLDYKDKDFNVISMMDVIEHLTDPLAAVKKASSLLRPGGIFLITTMDSDSLVSRLLGKRLEDFRRVREHLFFFNRKTIGYLLEKEGFEVLKIRSYGHTFRMDFLGDRLKLISPVAGKIFCWIIKFLHLSTFQFYINPGTKMIVFSRKIR